MDELEASTISPPKILYDFMQAGEEGDKASPAQIALPKNGETISAKPGKYLNRLAGNSIKCHLHQVIIASWQPHEGPS